MKIVYVAGPYTSPHPDVMEARRERALAFGRHIESRGRFVAFVPHAHILEPRGATPREVWKVAMSKCLANLRRCDALVPMPGWEDSRGARMEVWLCRRRSGYPPVVQVEDLEALHAAG